MWRVAGRTSIHIRLFIERSLINDQFSIREAAVFEFLYYSYHVCNIIYHGDVFIPHDLVHLLWSGKKYTTANRRGSAVGYENADRHIDGGLNMDCLCNQSVRYFRVAA